MAMEIGGFFLEVMLKLTGGFAIYHTVGTLDIYVFKI